MEKREITLRSPLFAGIESDQMNSLLDCLNAVTRVYRREEFVFLAGDKARSVGVVLSGGVYVLQEDFWGHRNIVALVDAGGLFGEAFSCAEEDTFPVSVMATKKTEVMLIDYRKITTTCSSACVFHMQLIKNMMRVLAEKNILLTEKIGYLGKRTTREKLSAFLSTLAMEAGTNIIEIPFNRQELADYLGVDRSALSRELGKMQTEGLLKYKKKCFELTRT